MQSAAGSLDNPRELSGCLAGGKEAGHTRSASSAPDGSGRGGRTLPSCVDSHSLMLVAAVLLLLFVSPDGLGRLVEAAGLWGLHSGPVSGILRAGGVVPVIVSLVKGLGINCKDSSRRPLFVQLVRVAGRRGARSMPPRTACGAVQMQGAWA